MLDDNRYGVKATADTTKDLIPIAMLGYHNNIASQKKTDIVEQ